MLKRFSHFFAYCLLVLIPLQGVAAANMSVCNSLMQLTAQQVTHNIPCHDGMSNLQHSEKSSEKHSGKNAGKAHCATVCANLNGMTALPSTAPTTPFLATAQIVNLPQTLYVSITQASLQRPPISII